MLPSATGTGGGARYSQTFAPVTAATLAAHTSWVVNYLDLSLFLPSFFFFSFFSSCFFFFIFFLNILGCFFYYYYYLLGHVCLCVCCLLQVLPRDVVVAIFDFVPAVEIPKLSRLCRGWAQLLRTAPCVFAPLSAAFFFTYFIYFFYFIFEKNCPRC
jgi:hypothetical protein